MHISCVYKDPLTFSDDAELTTKRMQMCDELASTSCFPLRFEWLNRLIDSRLVADDLADDWLIHGALPDLLSNLFYSRSILLLILTAVWRLTELAWTCPMQLLTFSIDLTSCSLICIIICQVLLAESVTWLPNEQGTTAWLDLCRWTMDSSGTLLDLLLNSSAWSARRYCLTFRRMMDSQGVLLGLLLEDVFARPWWLSMMRPVLSYVVW